jgi:hypothetical protein
MNFKYDIIIIGEMIDSNLLSKYDLIDGATILMNVWTVYKDLVKVCLLGNFEDILSQGVSFKIDWSSPSSKIMLSNDKKKYILERSGIALFILAHRGNIVFLKRLIEEHEANINYQSIYGRSPLMIAVSNNKLDIIEYMLDQKTNIDLEDINGNNALDIAKMFNNKQSLNRLTQFKWKDRINSSIRDKKKNIELDTFNELFDDRSTHQLFDSTKKTWLSGKNSQTYMMKIEPIREFSGSNMSAPVSIGRESNLNDSFLEFNLKYFKLKIFFKYFCF